MIPVLRTLAVVTVCAAAGHVGVPYATPDLLPVFSVVIHIARGPTPARAAGATPCQPGAALRDLILVQPRQATSRFALVTIADPRGRALVDVGPDDFVVEEGGQPREILDARIADYPIGVIIDNSVTARDDFPSMHRAIARFVERLGPRPVAIVAAGGTPKPIASLEDERRTVLAHLDALTVEGEAQPLRGAALAAETIRRTGTLFSALVLVTASPVEVSGQPVEDAIAPLVDSRAIIHVVARTDPGATLPLWRGLVDQTQGQYTAIYSAASYGPALDRLADRLTTEMVVEYLVPVGSRSSDPKVGIRLPGARVRGLGVSPR